MRYTGVTSRGIITPIFQQGDDLVSSIVTSVKEASENEGFSLNDGDIVGVTEAVVARTQGNYATTDQIAADVRAKLGGEDVGIVFPIMSRNRFSVVLFRSFIGRIRSFMFSFLILPMKSAIFLLTAIFLMKLVLTHILTALPRRNSASCSARTKQFIVSPGSTISNTTNHSATALRLFSQTTRLIF